MLSIGPNIAAFLEKHVTGDAGKPNDDVVYVDEPVSVEPTYTGKYK